MNVCQPTALDHALIISNAVTSTVSLNVLVWMVIRMLQLFQIHVLVSYSVHLVMHE